MKKCRLCGKDISHLHNRSIRCGDCQREMRILQNNTARRGKNEIYKKPTNMYIAAKIIAGKVEAGEIDKSEFYIWNYSNLELYHLYLSLRLQAEYDLWEKDSLEESYLVWMERKLKELES